MATKKKRGTHSRSDSQVRRRAHNGRHSRSDARVHRGPMVVGILCMAGVFVILAVALWTRVSQEQSQQALASSAQASLTVETLPTQVPEVSAPAESSFFAETTPRAPTLQALQEGTLAALQGDSLPEETPAAQPPEGAGSPDAVPSEEAHGELLAEAEPASQQSEAEIALVTEAPANAPEDVQEDPANPSEEPAETSGDQSYASSAAALFDAQDQGISTAQETPAPEPEETPAVEYDEDASALDPDTGLLPVYEKAETKKKRIAITIDDCFQTDNLKRIIAAAYKNHGKLTIFPIGENVLREELAEVLRICVNELDYEIENHTMTHSRVFRLSETQMAEEIWKQQVTVSQALGVNYHMHFFRLMGGDGQYDQRTSNYLDQLGYKGIAYWSLSGSDAEPVDIKASLAPGMVYLFHTTDRDTPIVEAFISYAVSKGYELVTLNELFGLPENKITDISTLETTMPEPQAYSPIYHTERKGDYSWAIVRIQERLHELGYLGDGAKSALNGSVADGVYGTSTAQAVAAFQAEEGLEVTGVADAETQRRLFMVMD